MRPWTIIISPSILSADFARLGEEVNAVLAAGADWIHFDVMDNHYVPNLTIGPLVCEALRKAGVKAPIDVHLMVSPVDPLVADFAKAGATPHQLSPGGDRSTWTARSSTSAIRAASRAWCSIRRRRLNWLDYVIDKIDIVLLMSVNPGFGGQKFIPEALAKLAEARARIERSRARYPAGNRRRRQGGECRGDRQGGRRYLRRRLGHIRQRRLCRHHQGDARADRDRAGGEAR